MRKAHAIHNEEACNLLDKQGGFNDWVVTTAFYSALHFVRYKVFPFTENGKRFIDIDEYYAHCKKSCPVLSRHKCLLSVVKNRFVVINSYYRDLYDKCMTARYHDYKVDQNIVVMAKRDLDYIKREALKSTPNR